MIAITTFVHCVLNFYLKFFQRRFLNSLVESVLPDVNESEKAISVFVIYVPITTVSGDKRTETKSGKVERRK